MRQKNTTGEICDWEWLMKHPNCNGCPRTRECDEHSDKLEKLRLEQKKKEQDLKRNIIKIGKDV